eukprot:TRINITY_DN7377_c0_g1_i6.p1 TRINITY_DN7377_c0_g1~~TRINITY_DN7377_c0_g1_i6.p1  ORF type:complete len:415 (-),score=94.53 TRINITY_DN7377_c0_g1_i6:162-1406(-)
MIRRTKASVRGRGASSGFELPPKYCSVRLISLSGEERELYDISHNRSKLELDEFLRQGTILKNYVHIFEMLVRLRQICDHPYLISSKKDIDETTILESTLSNLIVRNIAKNELRTEKERRKAEMSAKKETEGEASQVKEEVNEEKLLTELIETRGSRIKSSELYKTTLEQMKAHHLEECPICVEPIDDVVVTICLHTLCRDCLSRIVASKASCPFCKTELTNSDFISVPRMNGLLMDYKKEWKPSSKIAAITAVMNEILQKKEKIVVFSQFTGMLTLLEHAMSLGGIRFLRFDGSFTPVKRGKILEQFRKDEEISVLSVSLRAGGVGLNLTEANHVIICDPWWNPAIEEQAVDRIHRIGQKRDVFVYRFICKDTVEEKILRLQENKRELFDLTMTVSAGERKEKNLEKIKFLLS